MSMYAVALNKLFAEVISQNMENRTQNPRSTRTWKSAKKYQSLRRLTLSCVEPTSQATQRRRTGTGIVRGTEVHLQVEKMESSKGLS